MGFSLLNTPEVFTRFSFVTRDRPAVLDLSFANTELAPFVTSLSTHLPSPGSDHIPIFLVLFAPLLCPAAASPNWDKTDWMILTPALQQVRIPAPPPLATKTSLSAWFDRHLFVITSLYSLHTLLKHPFLHSKPWSIETLSRLHQDLHEAQRTYQREHTSSLLSESHTRRLVYFKAIKRAKKQHWKSFLTKVGAQDVWTAWQLAARRHPDRFPSFPDASLPLDINTALLSHFFPDKDTTPTPSILGPFRDVPSLGPEEIAYALSKSSNTSAPGPDQIQYGIWKEVNKRSEEHTSELQSP